MTDAKSKSSIIFVTLSLSRGGTERHLATLLPRLKDSGWNVSIFCLSEKGELASEVAKAGVNVIGPPLEGLSARANIKIILGAAKLAMIMIKDRPKIAHFFLPAAYLIGGPLSVLARIPVRVMSRRSLNHYQDRHYLAAKIERKLHPYMHAILANSNAIRNELINEEGCNPANIELIYNGVAPQTSCGGVAPREVRERFGIDTDAFVATVVANLLPYKGHADLIQAVSLVKERLPRKFHVLCVGRDDGFLGELKSLAIKYEVDGIFRFLGSRSDVPEILKASDIGILCSHEEGFSNAILEMMAAGVPTIVTDVGGNAEAVRNGIDGLVVPARNPAALGEAIIQLASDSESRVAMRSFAQSRIENTFSVESMISKYILLYQRLNG